LPVLIALAGCGRQAGAPGPATVNAPVAIVVYSALTQERTLAITDAYRQATGTTVNVLVEPGVELVASMARKEHYPGPDVVLLSGGGQLVAAMDADVLRPVRIDRSETGLDGVADDPDGYWHAIGVVADAIVYRADSVDEQAPGGYASLGEPGFAGKLCLRRGNDDRSRLLVASLIATLGARDAELAVRGWRSNLVASAFDSEAELVAALAAGQCTIGIAGTDSVSRYLDEYPDAELRVHLPAAADGGTLLHPAAAGVARHANDADAAQRFLTWLLTQEGQRVLHTRGGEFPVIAGVPGKPDAIAAEPVPASVMPQVLFSYADAIALIERARYR
jgi:iron(III) transport system substrate-binding protein